MPPLPLNYANAPKLWQRRLAKRIVAATLVITLTLTACLYGPHAYRFARQYYWQRKCMNFDPPSNTIVYERLPHGSPKPAIVFPYMDGNSPEVLALWYWNGKIHNQISPNDLYRVPICWVRYLQSTAHWTGGLVPPCVVFCHECTSPAGHRRLVTVKYPTEPRSFGDRLAEEMNADVYTPVGWNGCPPSVQDGKEHDRFHQEDYPMPRRIFAGQPDPADPSHFTIEYEWPDGVHGFIDGYLLDNDAVNLTDRPGPGDILTAAKSLADHPELWPRN